MARLEIIDRRFSMPLYAIARIAKQKGGSVASSGHHNDRTRETLNADPARLGQNRLLIGEDRNVRELVTEVIGAHGGKPRSDSVEAVEMVLTATPDFFRDEQGEIDQKRLDRFVEQAVAFLKDTRSGGICVKAILHLDEQTPHIQAHKVPIDQQGKLNCKHYFGGRQKMESFQDLYHEYMQPLGLERGERGSLARHTDIQDFYAAITKDHRLIINPELLPDPPLLHTKKAIQAYKEDIIRSVNEQVSEPLKVVHHQAMLTREERSKREEAEKRAAEKVAEAHRQAAEREAEAERMVREAQHLLTIEIEQNQALWEQNLHLQRVVDGMKKEVVAGLSKTNELSIAVKDYRERLSDIPMLEVMDKMGFDRELIGKTHVYRNSDGGIELMIADNKLYGSERQLISETSIGLVLTVNEDVETRDEAVVWLSDNFGARRATAAYLVERESAAFSFFTERNQVRERELMPVREPEVQRAAPDHDREDYGFSR
jgi:hypothetical protein